MGRIDKAYLEKFKSDIERIGSDITDLNTKQSDLVISLSEGGNLNDNGSGKINSTIDEIHYEFNKLNSEWDGIKDVIIADLNKWISEFTEDTSLIESELGKNL